jgi:hypothetical protein
MWLMENNWRLLWPIGGIERTRLEKLHIDFPILLEAKN